MSESGAHTMHATVAVLMAVLGLAIIALIVSQKSQAPSVLTTTGTAVKNLIACALSPVTGGSCGGLVEKVTSTINYGA